MHSLAEHLETGKPLTTKETASICAFGMYGAGEFELAGSGLWKVKAVPISDGVVGRSEKGARLLTKDNNPVSR